MPFIEALKPVSERFSERIHVYGGAGTGKSSVTLSIARACPQLQFHVIDLDYSYSYERLLATEYSDVDEQGNVHVYECEADWEQFADLYDTLVSGQEIEDTAGNMVVADPRKDFLTIDPVTLTWDMVQAWMIETTQGGQNVADFMAEQRAAADNVKEYMAAVAEGMSWPTVNKQYMEKFYKRFHKWRGHSILVSEAQEIGRQDDEKLKATYGHVGFRPKGQKTIPHVAATNIFMDHPDSKRWRITSIKDRGREPIDKMQIDDFATDYLEAVAGWERGAVKVEA